MSPKRSRPVSPVRSREKYLVRGPRMRKIPALPPGHQGDLVLHLYTQESASRLMQLVHQDRLEGDALQDALEEFHMLRQEHRRRGLA